VSRRGEAITVVVGDERPVERRLNEPLSLAGNLELRITEQAGPDIPVDDGGTDFLFGGGSRSGEPAAERETAGTDTIEQPPSGAW
jgi:hypothetical protein